MQVSNSAKYESEIIEAVLDAILEVSQIDPSSIVPDYKLGQDLGLSRIEIQRVLVVASGYLKLHTSFESCRIEDSTPRDLVAILKDRVWNTHRHAA